MMAGYELKVRVDAILCTWLPNINKEANRRKINAVNDWIDECTLFTALVARDFFILVTDLMTVVFPGVIHLGQAKSNLWRYWHEKCFSLHWNPGQSLAHFQCHRTKTADGNEWHQWTRPPEDIDVSCSFSFFFSILISSCNTHLTSSTRRQTLFYVFLSWNDPDFMSGFVPLILLK